MLGPVLERNVRCELGPLVRGLASLLEMKQSRGFPPSWS